MFPTVIFNETTAQYSFSWAADLVQLCRLSFRRWNPCLICSIYFPATWQHFIDMVIVVDSQLPWFWAVGFWPLHTMMSLFKLLLRIIVHQGIKVSFGSMTQVGKAYGFMPYCATKQTFSQLCHVVPNIRRVTCCREYSHIQSIANL